MTTVDFRDTVKTNRTYIKPERNMYSLEQLFDIFLAGYYHGKVLPYLSEETLKELFEDYIKNITKLEFVKYLEKENKNDEGDS